MTPNRSTSRAGGFTLIELVASMAMVAVIAMSLYAAMRIAFRAQQSAEEAVEPARTTDLAFELIRQDVTNMVPPGDFTVSATLLAGQLTSSSASDAKGRDNDSVELFTTASAPERASGNGEIKRVNLLIAAPEDLKLAGGVPPAAGTYPAGEPLLVRRVARNLLSTDVLEEDQVICRGVAALNLRFFDGADWQESWDSTQSTDPLPLAIEVTIDLLRPTPAEPERTVRAVRVFRVPCSTIQPTGLSSGSGLGSSTGGSR